MKISKCLISLIIALFFLLFDLSPVFAVDCNRVGVFVQLPQNVYEGATQLVNIPINGLGVGMTYYLRIDKGNFIGYSYDKQFTYSNGMSLTLDSNENDLVLNRSGSVFTALSEDGWRGVKILDDQKKEICNAGQYQIKASWEQADGCNFLINNQPAGQACVDNTQSFSLGSSNVTVDNTPFTYENKTILDAINPEFQPYRFSYLKIDGENKIIPVSINQGNFKVSIDKLSTGQHTIELVNPNNLETICRASITVFPTCDNNKKSLNFETGAAQAGKQQNEAGINVRPITEGCSTSGDSPALQTAIGCIPTSLDGFITWFFKFAIGIAGGIAFLFMAFGAFTLITSAGNPEKVKQGQEVVVSAAAGLIFILFATYLLGVIGVDILKIPGFS